MFGVLNGESRAAPRVKLTVNGICTEVLVDSGATCNLLGKDSLERLRRDGLDVQLTEFINRLFAYGGSELNVTGKFPATLTFNGKAVEAEVVVVRGKGEFLLGRHTATALEALVLPSVNTVEESLQREHLKKKFPAVFNGVGKLAGYTAKLHVDQTVRPVAQGQRRIPYAYVEAVEKKLKELQEADIVEEAKGPTPWVSPIVIAPKPNGDIRLRIDLRHVNEAIIRERDTHCQQSRRLFMKRMAAPFLRR